MQDSNTLIYRRQVELDAGAGIVIHAISYSARLVRKTAGSTSFYLITVQSIVKYTEVLYIHPQDSDNSSFLSPSYNMDTLFLFLFLFLSLSPVHLPIPIFIASILPPISKHERS